MAFLRLFQGRSTQIPCDTPACRHLARGTVYMRIRGHKTVAGRPCKYHQRTVLLAARWVERQLRGHTR